MDAFTAAFPIVRQTVKMHLLEDQAKELVQATKMGFGNMDEQMEAIHAQSDEQLQLHSEQGGKLKRVMQEHFQKKKVVAMTAGFHYRI